MKRCKCDTYEMTESLRRWEGDLNKYSGVYDETRENPAAAKTQITLAQIQDFQLIGSIHLEHMIDSMCNDCKVVSYEQAISEKEDIFRKAHATEEEIWDAVHSTSLPGVEERNAIQTANFLPRLALDPRKFVDSSGSAWLCLMFREL